jgi:hypothetical protein
MKRLIALAALVLVAGVGLVGFNAGEEEATVTSSVLATPSPVLSSSPASRAPASLDPIALVRNTRACLDSGNCDFPQSDSRSYEFAVNRRLAVELAEAHLALGAGAVEELSRELMSTDDGYVQTQAIRVFSALPPSRKNLAAMTSSLSLSHDPLVIEQAMKEFERYLGSPEEAMVQEFLADFIAHGGQFTAEKASSLVLRFLNERSESAFRAALASMIPESTAAVNLRRAIAEYERQNSGG